MLFAAGIVLLVLGLFSGAILLLGPLGVVPEAPGYTLWILFPAFTVVGYLMAAAPARDSSLPILSRITGALLMLLALAAGIGLVLQGGAIVTKHTDTTALWYVLVLGIVLGAAGLASHARIPRDKSAA